VCVSRKASFNFTWFLAWFSLVPKSVKSTKSYYTQHFGLVPALVQPGSDKVHVNKIILYAILGLGSCLGSPWFRRGPFGLPPALVRPGSNKVHVNKIINTWAWFLPWFSLVLGSPASATACSTQRFGLVPALVQPGSDKVHCNKIILYATLGLGSGLGAGCSMVWGLEKEMAAHMPMPRGRGLP